MNKERLNVFPKQKKGQVTIFIIIAIILVALVLLVYSFYPQISAGLGFAASNPQSYIQSCIEKDIQEVVMNLSLQGGNLNPENYVLYQNQKIDYLCYIGEDYLPCVVQKPLLKESIESQIQEAIEGKAIMCFNSLEESYGKKGYSVNLKRGSMIVELLPQKIVTTFDYSLNLVKGQDAESYDVFRVVLNNNLYELTSIADSIIEMETVYGDAETTIYMDYYHDLKVDKKQKADGTTIYIISERDTENKFQFASRSVVWPPGY